MLFHYWMLPILFILHDFEEMIMVSDWKNRKKVQDFPKQYFGNTCHAPAFSIGVFEELILLILFSLICQWFDLPLLYLAICLAYTSHFITHYVMCWQFKGYVPGVISATLEIPFMWLIITHYWQNSWLILLYCIPVFLITYLNIIFLHKMMATFENWLLSYTQR